jgi:WXXGXW repeat (2 copies)
LENKEEQQMKTKLLALLLLAGSTMFAGTRFFVGVGVGPTYVAAPPPAPVVEYAPTAYRPGYTWVGGYYYPAGPRWGWHAGYWARPPYPHAYWVAPRYYGHRYYGGYWRR